MLLQRIALVVGAAFALTFVPANSIPPAAAQGANSAAAALAGQVASTEEGPMEGVIVSAKKDGSTITVSVITNAQGRYSFPAARLEPGRYSLQIRAVGYDLEGPKSADVAAGAPTSADLKLRKTRNLSKQLTNAEWMMSVPGTDDDKLQLINCVSCHTLERVVKSSHDADEFVQVIARMNGYAQVSQPIKPQRRVDLSRAANPERFRKVAEYLATINLSSGMKHEFELKTLPRVKGRGTNVIITEYDLPRPTIEPHDVIVVNGEAWYTNFGEQFLGKLDPKTGKHTEYAMPELRKGFPTGNLDLGIDREGHLLLGMMYQGARRQVRSQDGEVPDLAASARAAQGRLAAQHGHQPGPRRRQAVGERCRALDPAAARSRDRQVRGVRSVQHPAGRPPGGYSIYDVRADSQNNVYVTDFQKNYVVKVDAKTGKFTAYQTGTPFSRNRRGRIDDQDRFWFAEYRGNKIAMFDTKEERIQEWPLPTKFTQPYDVIWDKNGQLWTGGMTSDRVIRLDPKSNEVVEYPLPRDTNMRRMFVDNSTTPPTFWVGSNHGASIVRVEPLD